MAISNSKNLVNKFNLPNGRNLDILANVISQIYLCRQIFFDDIEKGGFLIGYENTISGNYTVAECTYIADYSFGDRYSVNVGAPHYKILMEYSPPYGYIGTWHTHPQSIPYPSNVDVKSWKKAMNENKMFTKYLIFIISGTENLGVWVGDCAKNKIIKI